MLPFCRTMDQLICASLLPHPLMWYEVGMLKEGGIWCCTTYIVLSVHVIFRIFVAVERISEWKRFCICSLWSHLNVLTFFPPVWGMPRRFRCVQTFLLNTTSILLELCRHDCCLSRKTKRRFKIKSDQVPHYSSYIMRILPP